MLSDGHVRDSIKLLDKCLDASDSLTLSNVETILGLVKSESMIILNNAIVNKNLDDCLKELNHIKSYSSDLSKAFDDFINFSIDNAITSNRMSSVFLNFSNKAVLDKKTNYLLVNRLMAFRKYLNSSNAEAIFKTIFLEMCE